MASPPSDFGASQGRSHEEEVISPGTVGLVRGSQHGAGAPSTNILLRTRHAGMWGCKNGSCKQHFGRSSFCKHTSHLPSASSLRVIRRNFSVCQYFVHSRPLFLHREPWRGTFVSQQHGHATVISTCSCMRPDLPPSFRTIIYIADLSALAI